MFAADLHHNSFEAGSRSESAGRWMILSAMRVGEHRIWIYIPRQAAGMPRVYAVFHSLPSREKNFVSVSVFNKKLCVFVFHQYSGRDQPRFSPSDAIL